MIQVPEDGWGADTLDAPGTLLAGGRAQAQHSLTVPDWDEAGDDHIDDPVAQANSARERAGAVFRRQRSIGGFNRELDTLFAAIAETPDWSDGLERFDRRAEELRRRHANDLPGPEDREAFARHADEFAAMQRIGLKRALVERQASDALIQLDDQLAYYADKAANAEHDAFRQVAADSGLRTIDELREAGYLTAEAAEARKAAFLSRADGGPEIAAPGAARATVAATQPMESLAEWPTEGDATPPDMARELAVLLGPALVAILATPAGRLILQRLAPAIGRGPAKREAKPRRPRPAEESSPQPPVPVAPSSPLRVKPPVVPPPDESGRPPDKGRDRPDTSEANTKSEKEIADAQARWKEKGFHIDRFGPVFEDLRGDWKAGVQRLLKEQDGEVPGALHHPDIEGGIDLIWGKAGTGASDGYGVAKIAKYHPEVLDDLQSVISKAEVLSRSPNRVILESPGHRALLRLEFDGKKKTWLLTAYQKEASALRPTDD